MDLGVAGALEFLVDDVVHAAAGVDQGGGNDGQRAAFLDVAGRTEEALGLLQGVGIDATGQHLAGGRHDGVVGAGEAGQRVEQDDHVALVFDQALGLLDDHLGNLDVARRGLVEGRGDHLALDRALHLGDFLRPLVDQQHDHHDVGVVAGDRMGDVLQHHGLAALRAGHQHAALPLADRCDHVDHARSGVFLAPDVALELQALRRMERREVLEHDLVFRGLGRMEVDLVELDQREIALAVLRRADLAFDGVAGVQIETADLGRRDVDVVGACEVADVGRPQEAEAVGQYLEHAVTEDRLTFLRAILQQRKDEFLLPQPVGAIDLGGIGHLEQLADVQSLEL